MRAFTDHTMQDDLLPLIELVPDLKPLIAFTVILLSCIWAFQSYFRKKRKKLEQPHIAQLIHDLEEIGFFKRTQEEEYKLKIFRLLYQTYLILGKTINNLNQLGKFGLEKDLSRLRSETEKVIYHPHIVHMLNDTEQMKINEVGRNVLTDLRRTFYKTLSRQSKTFDKNNPVFMEKM